MLLFHNNYKLKHLSYKKSKTRITIKQILYEIIITTFSNTG